MAGGQVCLHQRVQSISKPVQWCGAVDVANADVDRIQDSLWKVNTQGQAQVPGAKKVSIDLTAWLDTNTCVY